ncbi:peptidase [Halorhodospira abdelmalekii]|uniref:penicillin-binding protein 1A n=1 Tax=Halorhodospira abdelmalekii TaxID=421629 RepID=UPI0019037CD1|nr:PBP1A family penicillin-binding protein [Halorhodospira abdelmalekii]MBK1734733.1 peptidase [Halorhodospira abdelmalekii]
MRRLLKIILYSVVALLGAGTAVALAALAYAVFVLAPQLPSAESLRDIRLQEPLRIVTVEGDLIAEYGEQRRQPKPFEELPRPLIEAFIAAEDRRFFEHPGVDYQGMLRAVWHVVRERDFGPGGSTITMQVARNFFLSPEQTILRKANEILLALQIEQVLEKEEILALYLNKIYLGNRAYGVAAAAQAYYGKSLDELTLAETAMIAGLPKAPSAANPLRNPQRALQRRGYVLARMRAEGFISEAQFREALHAPITARQWAPRTVVEARYVSEMVRRTMVERYGEHEAYTGGYTVYTTIEGHRQRAANEALRTTLHDYMRRHGYRGPEGRVDPTLLDDERTLAEALREHPPLGNSEAGVVLEIVDDLARVRLRDGDEVEVPFSTMTWAREYRGPNRRGPAPQEVADVVAPGDIIRVERADDEEDGREAALSAVPQVEGALVALSPVDGRIRALSGGYDYRRSAYNRAVQAQRQTGSALKPFIYSLALERGYTAATLINDAPVVFHDDALGSHWRPGNYSGRFYGPTRLREALVFSRNLVSIRVLRDLGVRPTIEFLEHFGFDPGTLSADLSLALGSNSASPLVMARAFAVFANGGYRIEPNVIERVEDVEGAVVFAPSFPEPCELCDDAGRPPAPALGEPRSSAMGEVSIRTAAPAAPRVIPADNAWLMSDMLADVVKRGTARGAARHIQRGDLAGKTGTTNDLRDAWFVGYSPDLVAAAWVGFDDQSSLGRGETGASAALPIWSRFMAQALEGLDERPLPRPDGLVTVRIDPSSGKVTGADHPNAVFETFRRDTVPARIEEGRDAGRSRSAERELF